jgi:hypothetical protein
MVRHALASYHRFLDGPHDGVHLQAPTLRLLRTVGQPGVPGQSSVRASRGRVPEVGLASGLALATGSAWISTLAGAVGFALAAVSLYTAWALRSGSTSTLLTTVLKPSTE